MVYEKVVHLAKYQPSLTRNLGILNKSLRISGLLHVEQSRILELFIIWSRIFKQGSRSLGKSRIYHSIPLIPDAPQTDVSLKISLLDMTTWANITCNMNYASQVFASRTWD